MERKEEVEPANVASNQTRPHGASLRFLCFECMWSLSRNLKTYPRIGNAPPIIDSRRKVCLLPSYLLHFFMHTLLKPESPGFPVTARTVYIICQRS